ncbi:MAG: hypothetical protein FWC79_00850 [Oscillospiraceae bacterium]|nr:hypothetical protein [Oscillospiraceae bacterium]
MKKRIIARVITAIAVIAFIIWLGITNHNLRQELDIVRESRECRTALLNATANLLLLRDRRSELLNQAIRSEELTQSFVQRMERLNEEIQEAEEEFRRLWSHYHSFDRRHRTTGRWDPPSRFGPAHILVCNIVGTTRANSAGQAEFNSFDPSSVVLSENVHVLENSTVIELVDISKNGYLLITSSYGVVLRIINPPWPQ